MAEQQEIYDKHKYLYHYTTMAGLKGILNSQTLRATHYKYLNDTSEINHMRQSLVDLLVPIAKAIAVEQSQQNSEAKKHIRKHGGVKAVAQHDSKAMVNRLYRATFAEKVGDVAFAEPFITSFCSHDRDSSYVRRNGLLSQWRSYGGKSGFAIVFDTKKLVRLLQKEGNRYHHDIGDLKTVVYAGNDEVFLAEFKDLHKALKKNFEAQVKGEKAYMGETLPLFVISVSRFKHEGFEEEREVRIITSPTTEALRKIYQDAGVYDTKDSREFKQIQVRRKGSRKIPYIELFDFPQSPILPIKRIIIGPHKYQRRLVKEVKGMIVGLGIEVNCCETPFVP